MSLFSWLNKVIAGFKWYDISLIKLSTAGFVLLMAKYFPVLLNAQWYWYVVVCVAAAIIPLRKMFKN